MAAVDNSRFYMGVISKALMNEVDAFSDCLCVCCAVDNHLREHYVKVRDCSCETCQLITEVLLNSCDGCACERCKEIFSAGLAPVAPQTPSDPNVPAPTLQELMEVLPPHSDTTGMEVRRANESRRRGNVRNTSPPENSLAYETMRRDAAFAAAMYHRLRRQKELEMKRREASAVDALVQLRLGVEAGELDPANLDEWQLVTPTGKEAKGKKKTATNAVQTAKLAQLPKERGDDALRNLSSAMSHDLGNGFVEAVFTGTPARCPLAPMAETAVIGDKITQNLHHAPGYAMSTDQSGTDNVTLVFPSISNTIATTSQGPTSLSVNYTNSGNNPMISTRFHAQNPTSENSWCLSEDLAFLPTSTSGMLMPIALHDSANTATGYQCFDQTQYTGVTSPGGFAITDLYLVGDIYLDPLLYPAGGRTWTLWCQIFDLVGIQLGEYQITFASTELGLTTQMSAGLMYQFNFANNIPTSTWGASYPEVIRFELRSTQTASDVEITGTLNFLPIWGNNSQATQNSTVVIPYISRHLDCFDCSTYKTVAATDVAVRTLTALATFDGPHLTQGGFIACSEIPAGDVINRKDLLDFVSTRPENHRGKIVEGAYGVWVPDRLQDYEYHRKGACFNGDTKYLIFASFITDTTQTLNLTLQVCVGYEFPTNSLLFQRDIAQPLFYPQHVRAVISALPRFSSNDGHVKEVIRPAKAVGAMARSPVKKPWWKSVIETIGKVGKAVLPVLPAILAAL